MSKKESWEKPITPEYAQRLYELDMMMVEYRKNCKIPGTPEYEEQKRGEEALRELAELLNGGTKTKDGKKRLQFD